MQGMLPLLLTYSTRVRILLPWRTLPWHTLPYCPGAPCLLPWRTLPWCTLPYCLPTAQAHPALAHPVDPAVAHPAITISLEPYRWQVGEETE